MPEVVQFSAKYEIETQVFFIIGEIKTELETLLIVFNLIRDLQLLGCC